MGLPVYRLVEWDLPTGVTDLGDLDIFPTELSDGRVADHGGLFGGDMTFRLQPDLPTYSSDAARRALAVDAVAVGIQGTNSVYQLGTPRWADFRWPGAPGAFVTVQRQLGPLTQDFEGDWAAFRLMEAASIRPRGGTAYDVSWSFRDGPHTVTVRYEMRTTSENSPLANPSGVLRFSLPRSAN